MSKEFFKNQFIEISLGGHFALNVSQYHERYVLVIGLIFATFYIKLPNFGYDIENWDRQWGVYYFDKSFVVCYGKESKFFHMPWSWEHIRHQVMHKDGLKTPNNKPWDWDDGRIVEKYNYSYKLKNGATQETIATICMEEREWRWRWFKWLPFPRIIRRVIDIKFDNEIGERSGSWKGGTTGCGYDMLKGESMEQTLRRMERERVFR